MATAVRRGARQSPTRWSSGPAAGAPAPSAPPLSRFSSRRLRTLGIFGLVILSSLVASGAGAFSIPLRELPGLIAAGPDAPGVEAAVLWTIRLPRVGLGLAAGAGLSVAGLLLQALLRNPLASPEVMGVSAGAALGAAAAIVVGLPALAAPLASTLAAPWASPLAPLLAPLLAAAGVPLAAFAGALLTTGLVLGAARRAGATDLTALLLAGIAANAIAGALTGVLVFVADDAQLRSLTFWSLGSLGGASWAGLAAVALPVGLLLLLSARVARDLDLLQLGEVDAALMGVPVERRKTLSAVAVALAVGAVVAAAGGLGFLGLVVPHLARLWVGPLHRELVPTVALLGAGVLVLADLACRTVAAPAELPVGLFTTLLATPAFLMLLRQHLRGRL